MQAKCPYCDDGCEKCDGRGFVEVRIAEGAFYTIKCQGTTCGFENGGRIVGPDLPPLPPEGKTDWGSDLICIVCGAPARYELIGWSGADGGRE